MDRQSERDTARCWKNWEKERDKELKRERLVFQESTFWEGCRRRWALSSTQRQTERAGGVQRDRAGQSLSAATQEAKGQTTSMAGTAAVWCYDGWAPEKILTAQQTSLCWQQTALRFMFLMGENLSKTRSYWERKPHLSLQVLYLCQMHSTICLLLKGQFTKSSASMAKNSTCLPRKKNKNCVRLSCKPAHSVFCGFLTITRTLRLESDAAVEMDFIHGLAVHPCAWVQLLVWELQL